MSLMLSQTTYAADLREVPGGGYGDEVLWTSVHSYCGRASDPENNQMDDCSSDGIDLTAIICDIDKYAGFIDVRIRKKSLPKITISRTR